MNKVIDITVVYRRFYVWFEYHSEISSIVTGIWVGRSYSEQECGCSNAILDVKFGNLNSMTLEAKKRMMSHKLWSYTNSSYGYGITGKIGITCLYSNSLNNVVQ
jgi:hypothetical protein